MKVRSHIGVALSRVILFGLIFSFVSPGSPFPASADTNFLGDPCHIAITVVNGTEHVDLSTVGVSSFLNWGYIRSSHVASNIEHVKIMRVRNDLYPSQFATLLTIVPQNPGQVWIIGNEPDVPHSGQDNLLPEVYAERFYDMAKEIRRLDLTARIGFAPIAQASPLRRKYLDRVWARLIESDLAGSAAGALNLIDTFTIHGFTVNEKANEWGARIPPGLDPNDPAVYVINIFTELYKTHSIELFSEWVTGMRQWMKDHGARNKPLWVTEYGSLMPPLDPPGADFVNVTDEETRAYLLASFEFIYNGTDPNIGYPADNNRLVQRGYWYSLNEFRYRFGGSLFDPITKQRTIVGDAFVDYDPPASVPLVDQDPYLISVSFNPLRYTPGSGRSRVDYRVDVRVGNNVTAENRVPVNVDLSLDGVPVGPLSGYLSRCGGVGIISFFLNNIEPVEHTVDVNVSIDPTSVMQDIVPGNNSLQVVVTPSEPETVFLPLTLR